ncbi:MAG: hypothetical protein AAGB14_04430 [Verrucomicrobiota bacterium]
MKTVLTSILLSASVLAVSCNQQRRPVKVEASGHVLEGGWLATDGTIFVFRPDGTFHGYDFRHREIWGNWVTLSAERIGFQSLLHGSYYLPQYAIIREGETDRMDFIVTGGEHFISAKRVAVDQAVASIDLVIEKELHRPEFNQDGELIR